MAAAAVGGSVSGVGLPRAHASVRVYVDAHLVRVTASKPTVASALAAAHVTPHDGAMRSALRHRVIDAHVDPARIYLDGRVATTSVRIVNGSVIGVLDGRDTTEVVDRRTVPVAGTGLPPVEFTLWHLGRPGVDEIDVGRVSGEVVRRINLEPGGVATPVTERVVALTFDDGPDLRSTPAVLDILRDEGVKATFCFVGHWADKRADMARRVAAEGHVLCDHTVHHILHLEQRPNSQIVDEIDGGADIVKRVCGVDPSFYRAPGGTFDQDVLDVAHRRGLRVLGWSIDPHDYERPPPDVIRARIVAAVKPGAVILLHDGGGDRGHTVEMLRTLIDELKFFGYGFVTPEVVPPPSP